MIDTHKIELVGNVLTGFSYILMFIALFLQIVSFTFLPHIFMCSLISVLVLGGIICSIICKAKKESIIRATLLTFWITNLMISLIIC